MRVTLPWLTNLSLFPPTQCVLHPLRASPMVMEINVLYPNLEQKLKKSSTMVFYTVFQNGFVPNVVPNLEHRMAKAIQSKSAICNRNW